MRRIQILLFIQFFIFTSAEINASDSDKNLLVHSVTGEVYFSSGGKKVVVNDFMTFSDQNGFFIFKNSSAELLYRIISDNSNFEYKILKPNVDGEKYDLSELFSNDSSKVNSEKSTLQKFLDINRVVESENMVDKKMSLAAKSGVNRNFLDSSTVILEDIEILCEMPFKIDFSNFFDLNLKSNQKSKYNISIIEKYSKKLISSFDTHNSFFVLDPKDLNESFFLIWQVKIKAIELDKNIVFTVIEKPKKNLNNSEIKILGELANELNIESNFNKTNYQILLIENLLDKGLIANANYFLDHFINLNEDPLLISYKNHYKKK